MVVDRDVDLFQSTLLQEERQLQYFSLHAEYTISIHAPTRGATYNCRHSHGPWHFNPRSYKRSDAYYVDPSDGDFISIHAPTRGATVIILKDLVMYQFQSTLLQEERHSQMYFLYSGMNFNPRSYKRSDCYA